MIKEELVNYAMAQSTTCISVRMRGQLHPSLMGCQGSSSIFFFLEIWWTSWLWILKLQSSSTQQFKNPLEVSSISVAWAALVIECTHLRRKSWLWLCLLTCPHPLALKSGSLWLLAVGTACPSRAVSTCLPAGGSSLLALGGHQPAAFSSLGSLTRSLTCSSFASVHSPLVNRLPFHLVSPTSAAVTQAQPWPRCTRCHSDVVWLSQMTLLRC